MMYFIVVRFKSSDKLPVILGVYDNIDKATKLINSSETSSAFYNSYIVERELNVEYS